MLEKSFGEDESLEHGTLDWSIQTEESRATELLDSQASSSVRRVLNRQREIVYSIRNDVCSKMILGKFCLN